MGFIASASVVVAGGVWGLRLLLAPGLFEEGSGALLAVTVVVASAVAGLGLVVVRGRWARRLAAVLLGAELVLAAVMDLDAWGWTALACSAAAVVLVAGPWLNEFLRQREPADPPPWPAVVLAIGLVFVPGVLAAGAPGGVAATHWAAGMAALVTAWAYARAVPAGLWSARLFVPVVVAVAGAASPPLGMMVAFAAAVFVAALAWSSQASLAINPLVPTAEGVAIPPELVPPGLLAQAGYDDRGRPIDPGR